MTTPSRARALHRTLLRAVVIGFALISVQAYPALFASQFAQSCTDHPTRRYAAHGSPANDMSTAFSLISASAGSPTPVSSVCPGYTYQVSIDYGGIPRNTLLTSSVGSLNSSTDKACPNRSIGMTPTPVYTDELTVPCDATAGSPLELKVTSASGETDSFHQASATYGISALDQCPQTTCKPVKAATGAPSSTPAPAAAPKGSESASKNSTKLKDAEGTSKTSTKSKDTPPASPAPGLGLLAKILNMTHSAQDTTTNSTTKSGVDASAPAVAAAAGPIAAAMAAAAKSSPSPSYRRAGDFPILSRLSTAATDLEKQPQTAAANMGREVGSSAQARSSTPITNVAVSGGPVVNGFLRAADGAAQNLTEVVRSLNTTNNSTPVLDSLRRLGNRGSGTNSSSSGVLGAGNQWQAVLQRLQKALSGMRPSVAVHAADQPGSVLQPSVGMRQQSTPVVAADAAQADSASDTPVLDSLLPATAHNVDLDTP